MSTDDRDATRPGEISIEDQEASDASLAFIGVIHTPFKTRADCPRQGSLDGPECTVEIFDPWVPALTGLEDYQSVELLYWLHRARRDLVVQNPSHTDRLYGTFALRSPVRPNPIGLSTVRLLKFEGRTLIVAGLDCLDGTPLLDVKPDRSAFTPKAPQKS